MSNGTISESDAAEAKRRAEWLHKHKAHKDWIILSVSEVAVIRDELLILERERDEAREEIEALRHEYHGAKAMAGGFKDKIKSLTKERDEARESLSDWENAALHVEADHPDEKHCGCVPILRKLLTEAREKYDNLATEHMLVVNKLCEERNEAREVIREIWQSGDAFLPYIDEETTNRWRKAAGW